MQVLFQRILQHVEEVDSTVEEYEKTEHKLIQVEQKKKSPCMKREREDSCTEILLSKLRSIR